MDDLAALDIVTIGISVSAFVLASASLALARSDKHKDRIWALLDDDAGLRSLDAAVSNRAEKGCAEPGTCDGSDCQPCRATKRERGGHIARTGRNLMLAGEPALGERVAAFGSAVAEGATPSQDDLKQIQDHVQRLMTGWYKQVNNKFKK